MRMRAYPPCFRTVEPADDAVLIQEILRWDRIFSCWRTVHLVDLERVQEFRAGIRKEFIAGSEAFFQARVMLRGIDAHRVNVYSRRPEPAVILLQLAELHYAKRSPVALIEEHQHRTACEHRCAGYRLSPGIKKREIGESVANLQQTLAALSPIH
jgi:hypothetical protein